MRFSLLAFGLLWSGISARPHPDSRLPASTTVSTSTSTHDATATGISGLRRRSVEAGQADPGDLIYEDTPNEYVFEIGYELVDKLNDIGSKSCATSEDDCTDAVNEVLNALPETGNYFVRSDDNKDPRQASAVIGAEVAIWAYMLHKIFSEPEPKRIHVDFDSDANDKGPIEVSLPKANFPESVTGTETTSTTDVPFEKFLLITTPLATNEKGVLALSSAIAAIATDGPVVPSISDYGQELPGWFQVNATLEQQLEIALLPGVEHLVDNVGLLDIDSTEIVDHEESGHASAFRRSEMEKATDALVKRGTDSRDLPIDAPDDHGACLRFASWGDGMQSAPEYYAYQEKQGQDYPIYSMERGFDLGHEEFQGAKENYPDHDPFGMGQAVDPDFSWFNGHGSEFDSRTSLTDSNPSNTAHGTSMISMLMGKTVGLLPRSRPFLVRIKNDLPGFEAGLRSLANHIYQRQLTKGERRSSIVAVAQMPEMYDVSRPAHQGQGDTWLYSSCVWGQRVAHHLQYLVDLGATVVLASGNYDSTRPYTPPMTAVIALGLGQKCWDQHRVELPHVSGLHVVNSVDTATRLSLRKSDAAGYDYIGVEFSGPWECPSVQYDAQAASFSIKPVRGTSITTYWVAGVFADLAYQAEDKNELPDPDTPPERSVALYEAAEDLTWYVNDPDPSLRQHALWNGLRRLDGRNASSTATPEPTSTPSTSSTALQAATTSPSPPPPPPQSWASGWCGVHVKQKLYNSRASQLTVTIKDADKREIGGDDGDGPNLDYGHSHDVSSELPEMMIVTAPGPNEPINFAYGSQTWTSDYKNANGDPQCSVGKWDSGALGSTKTRNMDCGFEC